ncbi:circularly permuted type 2 ATP-grasp protein [bacterium]|nr:circularly permuted type 2 ATP-grasp protein [bacterium]
MFENYECGFLFDEAIQAEGAPRPGAESLIQRLQSLSSEELQRRQRMADATMLNLGITFNVYGHEGGTEKIFPFDIIPRIVEQQDWNHIERGLQQRIRALNLFIDDLYNDQKVVKDHVFPRELLETAATLRPQCQGVHPHKGIWCHITGTDLVRDRDGTFYVLEDNLRVPSGVSYVLENREVMKRIFPQVFGGLSIAPVENYPEKLLGTLQHCAPPGIDQPNIVVLTPGIFNSAYFEHSFLAQQMGVELVQGSDLAVVGDRVYMRTTKGLKRVDVIYRRIDDDFLDPLCFREDSALGVPGLMDVYRKGNVSLANAPGNGVADDKAVYAFVPALIKYYLGEDAILPNVPTYLCHKREDRQYVLDHLAEMVVKPTNESGGYGIVIGPKASRAELDDARQKILANPRNFVAQPLLHLSTVPTLIDGAIEARHVDLRPFVLCGEDIYVLPGGLTRVALKKGSTVVNSSQGGGSKDTWVVKRNGTHAPGMNGAAQRQSQSQLAGVT